MSKKNVFVLGADDFNLELLKSLDKDHEFNFHKLFDYEYAKEKEVIPIQELYLGGVKRLRDFNGAIDAIVGFWDFPISTMLPMLRKPFNLPSPSFEAVLKCEHKYWSRIEQKKSVPNNIPKFCAVNPYSPHYKRQITVDYPFWIKPVKSVASHLGFKVCNEHELEKAVSIIREKLPRMARPFNYLLQFANLPRDIKLIDGHHCIVESIISEGEQCTLEGYVSGGKVVVYGVIDSIREGEHQSSFSRYQYPSKLPLEVQDEMCTITRKFFQQINYDQGPFNIEFFWNPETRKINLLEVNTRISKSHGPLFYAVDGQYHHRVMIDLGLGREIQFPYREGRHKIAAKFMWRKFEDAKVEKVPDQKIIEVIQNKYDVEILLTIREGIKLSELVEQDSYSFEVANIFIGGENSQELIQKYEKITEEISPHLQLTHEQRTASWSTSTSSPTQSSI
ncbi:MAG: ATP-grasp domain-containing protein [Bacteriovoracaceae bacterium]|nr:ATP-grasp domain-containing protein [Bacteriovoracaceae bacterium]